MRQYDEYTKDELQKKLAEMIMEFDKEALTFMLVCAESYMESKNKQQEDSASSDATN